MVPCSTLSKLGTFLLQGGNFCSTNKTEHFFGLIAFVVVAVVMVVVIVAVIIAVVVAVSVIVVAVVVVVDVVVVSLLPTISATSIRDEQSFLINNFQVQILFRRSLKRIQHFFQVNF